MHKPTHALFQPQSGLLIGLVLLCAVAWAGYDSATWITTSSMESRPSPDGPLTPEHAPSPNANPRARPRTYHPMWRET